MTVVSIGPGYRTKYPERTPLALNLTNVAQSDVELLLSDCFYDLVEAEKEQEAIRQRFNAILLGFSPGKQDQVVKQEQVDRRHPDRRFDRHNRRVA